MIRNLCWTACIALTLAGCGAPEATDTTAVNPGAPVVTAPGAPGEPAPADAAPAASKYTYKTVAKIDELPEAEKALAKTQDVCLVSGEKLGTEGMEPVAIVADGKTVGFLCCDGCKGDFEADPAKFLAKQKKGE